MLRRCDRTNVGCDGICEGGNMGVGQMVGDRDATHLKKKDNESWQIEIIFFFVIRQLMAKTENDLQSKQPTSTTHIWKLFHKASKHHSDNRVLSNDTESDTGVWKGGAAVFVDSCSKIQFEKYLHGTTGKAPAPRLNIFPAFVPEDVIPYVCNMKYQL